LRVEEKLKIYFDDFKNPVSIQEESFDKILKTKDNNFEKTLKLKQYYYNIINKKKINLNTTMNKFDSMVIKKIESFILNDIFILQKNKKFDEKRKDITIINKIFNPTYHRFDSRINDTGVETRIFEMGSQINEFVVLNLEDFFFNLEKSAQEKKNKNSNSLSINFELRN